MIVYASTSLASTISNKYMWPLKKIALMPKILPPLPHTQHLFNWNSVMWIFTPLLELVSYLTHIFWACCCPRYGNSWKNILCGVGDTHGQHCVWGTFAPKAPLLHPLPFNFNIKSLCHPVFVSKIVGKKMFLDLFLNVMLQLHTVFSVLFRW